MLLLAYTEEQVRTFFGTQAAALYRQPDPSVVVEGQVG